MILNMVENFSQKSMKKIVSIMAGMLCLMACNKVETPSNNTTLSAVATIDTQTKTVYTDNGIGAGMKVDWADEDSFKAYYSGSSEPVIFSKTEAGTSFKAESVPDGVTSATAFTGLYGSNATYNGSINIDFSKQNGELDNIKDFDVMLASSELTDGALSFAFKHKCAILRVTIQNKYASTSTNKDVKQLNLVFKNAKIDEAFASGCLGTYSYSDKQFWANFKTLDVPPQTTKTYYFAVPAMEYIKDESLYDSIGMLPDNTVEKTISFNDTTKPGIVAGKVYDISLTFQTVQPD